MKDKKKKQNALRTWFQAAWFVLTNGYIRGFTKGTIYTGSTKIACLPGLNCYSCPGALGSCPIGALQAVLGSSGYRISLYVFGMLAAMGVIFGRLVCGWMCPFGLFQDLLHKIPLGHKRKNLPGHRSLRWLRYVVLVVMVVLLPFLIRNAAGAGSPWFCEFLCPSGMLLGAIPLVSVNATLRAAAGLQFVWKAAVLIAITLLSIWYYRPFCKYLCPLGAIYGLFNPISTYRLEIDRDACVSCGACQSACGMDIRTFQAPNSPDCIRCGSCMAACPHAAITSTWGAARRKIGRRCFVEDGSRSPAETALPAGPDLIALPKQTTLFGLLMVAGGLINGAYVGYLAVFNAFHSHFTIDLYQNMNPANLVMGVLWLLACLLVLLTGIFAIWHRNDPVQIMTLGEKVKIAFVIAIIGLAAAIIGAVADLTVLSAVFSLWISEIYPLFGILLLIPIAWMLRCQSRGQGKALPRIVYAVLMLLLLVPTFWLGILILVSQNR